MSTFATQNVPPHLIGQLPHPETPWVLSDSLQGRLDGAEKEGSLSYKKCVVVQQDSEWDFVWKAFHHQKPTYYGIKRVYCIYKEESLQEFQLQLKKSKIQAEDPLFQPKLEPHPERTRVMERWKEVIGPDGQTKKVQILPLWHGSKAAKISSICHLGFFIPGKEDAVKGIERGDIVDPGYFGSGLYFTGSARYAANVYCKDGHLLLSWVLMREPYPIIFEDKDKKTFLGKGNHGFHDAHYIPVVSGKPNDPFYAVYEPPKPGQDPMCDEIVVFNPAQTLAAFWIELQPDLPYSPAMTPEPVERLLRFVIDVLRHSGIEHNEKLTPLLKKLTFMLRDATYPSNSLNLIEQYEAALPFFKEHPFSSEQIPYVNHLLNVMEDWEETFASEALFKAFPALLEHFLGQEGWTIGCDILITLLETSHEATLPILKRFLRERPTISLAEFAFSSIQEVDHGVPLVDGAVNYLLKKNSLPDEHERLYTILSKKLELEPLRQYYLSFLQGSLLNRLAPIPSIAGYRQKIRIEQSALIQQITAITETTPTSVKVTAPFFKEPRYLKQEYISAKMDGSNIKGDKKYEKNRETGEEGSAHRVCQIKGQGIDLHLKQQPTQPMQEYAVYSLTCRTIGEGAPPSTLVRFDVGGTYYPVLISQTIEGPTLKEVFKMTTPGATPSFDNAQLTHLQLLGILTRPGDGRASNFIVKGRKIYSVDNDVSFVDPIVQEKLGKTVYFKSILYCLDQPMLDSDVCKAWTTLSPEWICKGWIDDLIEREKGYASLFTTDELKKLYEQNTAQKFTPYLVLRKGTITTLYTQFHKLQHLLRETIPTNGLDLLNHLIMLKGNQKETNLLSPLLYKRYNEARANPNPLTRLQIAIAVKAEQSVTDVNALKAGVGKVPTPQEIRDIYSLAELEKEFNSYAPLNQGGVFATDANGKLSIRCDFNTIKDPERQTLILNGLKKWITFSKDKPQAVSLVGCSVLTPADLIPFLHPGLVSLDLTNSSIETLPPEIQTCHLKELRLTACSKLVRLTSTNKRFQENLPLKFPYLKTLDIDRCDRLAEVRLESICLQQIKANDSPKLTKVAIKGSPLAEINLRGSAKLAPEQVFIAGREFDLELNPEFVAMLAGVVEALLKNQTPKPNTLKQGEAFLAALKRKLKGQDIVPYDLTHELKSNRNIIGADEAKALASVLPSTQLTTLALRGNGIGDAGASAIAAVLPSTTLTTLDLWNNGIGDAGASAIAAVLPSTTLTTLYLWSNGIGEEGASAIAAVLPSTPLTTLDLMENEIGEAGASAIASVLPSTTLTTLYLGGNQIGEAGASAIAAVLPLTTLTTLYLGGNQIGDGAKRLFVDLRNKNGEPIDVKV